MHCSHFTIVEYQCPLVACSAVCMQTLHVHAGLRKRTVYLPCESI